MPSLKAPLGAALALLTALHLTQGLYILSHSHTPPAIQSPALEAMRAAFRSRGLDPDRVRMPAGLTFGSCALLTFEVFWRRCGKLIVYATNEREKALVLRALPLVISQLEEDCRRQASPLCGDDGGFAIRIDATFIERRDKPRGGYTNAHTRLKTFMLVKG